MKMTEPITFRRGLTLKNRIVMAPMTVKMSFYDGIVTDDEIAYYQMRAGAIGAIITGAANVQPNGKGWEGELGVDDDKQIPRLAKLASAIQTNGTKAILQIFHAGRMTDSSVLRGKTPVSASAVPTHKEWGEVPREMSHEEILAVIDNYAKATRRAIQAGFDGVELHGANLYLIQQFFSPHSNIREDMWGGSLEKRYTFIDQVVSAVTKVVDDSEVENFIVGFRFSPEEFTEPGIRFTDALYLVDQLADTSLDYLHVSLRDYQKKPELPAYQEKTIVEYLAEKIAGRIPLIGVGEVTTQEDAEKLLTTADIAALGKILLSEPNWYNKVIHQQEDLIRHKISSYDREELHISNGAWGFLIDRMADRID